MSARSALKQAAERLLLGPAHVTRAFHFGRTVVLAYHNIVPDGEAVAGDRSLHLTQRAFAGQLDRLAQTHEVVGLESLSAPAGRMPRAVITIDDAYHGAVTAGLDELVRRGMPATIFVAPGLLDGRTFWWDELADPATGSLAGAFRAYALEALAGDGERILGHAVQHALPRQALPEHCRGASTALLVAAAQRPRITLGGHSWSHANLAVHEPARLQQEMAAPLAWLRERSRSVVPWCAYPYGLQSEPARGAARTAGYVGAFLVAGGWLPRRWSGGDWFALPRLNVPAGLSLDGFALRLAGLLRS